MRTWQKSWNRNTDRKNNANGVIDVNTDGEVLANGKIRKEDRGSMDTDKVIQDLNRRFAAPCRSFISVVLSSGTMKIKNLGINWMKWFWKMQT